MPEQKKHRVREWFIEHKEGVIVSLLGVLFVIILAQFLYPRDRMLPYTYVDNIDVSGWQKKDVVWELDKRYAEQPIQLYIGENGEPFAAPKPSEIGLQVINSTRVDEHRYPWYMRLLPTSILWYETVAPSFSKPRSMHDYAKAESYIKKNIGNACNVKPVNATIKVEKNELVVVPAQDGGTCKLEDVTKQLQTVAPNTLGKQELRVAADSIKPKVTTTDAETFSETIQKQVSNGVTIKTNEIVTQIDADTLISWLSISAKNNKLIASVSAKKASSKLQKEIGEKVYRKAGTSYVTTKDFTEVSRTDGARGRQLDVQATVGNLTKFVRGTDDTPVGVVSAVQPSVVYTRTYSKSDVGLSALMQQYAEDHKGIYGVQLIELDGQKRRASYSESKQFTTASTYKLFVAYSTLKKVEAGSFKWSQQIQGGRNLETCFDDMIVKSDNACAEALIEKISHATLQADVNSLGLTNTSFSHATMNGSAYVTTASDLATFLAALQTGSMPLSNSSRETLLNAMKRNIYRQGIPAGTSATVADKVGFLAAILNDAAVVYSPKGTYVLVIMSDNATWGNIADLTSKIEKLR